MTTTTRRFGATLTASTALVLATAVVVPLMVDSAPPASAAVAAKPKAPNTTGFTLILKSLPACKEEDGSASRLPCAWIGSRDGLGNGGLDFVVVSQGRRNRKTHLKPVAYIYRDGHVEHGTI